MISGRSRASGRLEALSPSFHGPQIGIGYYETVEGLGSDYFLNAPAAVPAAQAAPRLPQVVAAPTPGSAALLPQQRAALSALTVMGLFACAIGAVWAGKETVQYLRRTA